MLVKSSFWRSQKLENELSSEGKAQFAAWEGILDTIDVPKNKEEPEGKPMSETQFLIAAWDWVL